MPIKDNRLWECNIDHRDIPKIIKMNTFSVIPSIWSAWAKITHKTDLQYEEILEEKLWGNSFIRRKNLPIFDKQLINSNMDTILDIVNTEKKCSLSCNELTDQFGPNIDMLFYCSLRAAIPSIWKYDIRNNELDRELEMEQKINSKKYSKAPARTMYWGLLEKKHPINETLHLIWGNDLSIKIEKENFMELFTNFLKLVKPSKLRILQYKILTKSLTTNIKRYRWKKIEYDTCTFCSKEKESILHLLAQCPKVQKIWSLLSRWCKHHLDLDLALTHMTIIFNNYVGPQRYLINMLIAITKQYIYAQKCFQAELKFTELVYKFNYWYEADKMHAIEEGEMSKFRKKWQNMF